MICRGTKPVILNNRHMATSETYRDFVLEQLGRTAAPKKSSQGFSATTLPSFQKYKGVPYILAVLRAALAARFNAGSTRAAKPFATSFFVFFFMTIVLLRPELAPSFHTPPNHLPVVDTT
jgi:hypothetical protein